MTGDSKPADEALEVPGIAPSGAWLGQLGRLRYQYLGAIVIAVLVPVYFRWGGDAQGWLQPLQVHTIVASSLAILVGLVTLRQLTSLPGARESFYLVPAFGISFLIVLAVLFFGRIEYNRFLFPWSFVLSIIWVYFAISASRPFRRLHFAVVPGGDVGRLKNLPEATWTPLAAPELVGRFSGVVADLRENLTPDWERFIAECAVAGVRVFHVKQLAESLSGRVEIEHLSENTLGSLNPDALYLKLKQVADFALALAVGVALVPLFVVIAVLIRLDSPGPVVFRQERVGFRGQRFTLYKFRTMTVDAPAHEDAVNVACTQPDDQRVTRMGRFLRRTRIDELPQLFNILRGEMSWIGPRPEAVALSEWYEKELPFYRYRHIVRPGISGWAQVNQGHVTDAGDVLEKLHYDFYYIKNFSPWLDALIVLRTIRTVLTGFGAR